MFSRELFRTAPFRLAASFSAAFGFCTLVLFAFIYWQVSQLQIQHVDRFMRDQVRDLARQSSDDMLRRVDVGLASDLHRMTVAAVFSAGKTRISGNLPAWPAGLPVDGKPHSLRLITNGRIDHVRVVALENPDGRTIVVGRNIEELIAVRGVVGRALGAGLAPMVLLALGAGVLLSFRTLARLRRLNVAIEQIVGGNLAGRLPSIGTGDDLDRLIRSVNGMLGDLERLIVDVKTVGDNIAHDLRTPLARLRAKLERGRDGPASVDNMRKMLDDAIAEVDGATAIVSALLRLTEIEAGQRRAAFAPVDLAEIIGELDDLYRPMADAKRLAVSVTAPCGVTVYGDRDLLMEALANLVDNGIKFTPPDGQLDILLAWSREGATVTIADSGPGIPRAEQQDVFKRFYRGDRSRHTIGSGLGLSIVAAIVRLHGFTLTVEDKAPGCRFVLRCTPWWAAGRDKEKAAA